MIFKCEIVHETNFSFKVCQVAQASVAYLDNHLTLDPVMGTVQFPRQGGNFLLKML